MAGLLQVTSQTSTQSEGNPFISREGAVIHDIVRLDAPVVWDIIDTTGAMRKMVKYVADIRQRLALKSEEGGMANYEDEFAGGVVEGHVDISERGGRSVGVRREVAECAYKPAPQPDGAKVNVDVEHGPQELQCTLQLPIHKWVDVPKALARVSLAAIVTASALPTAPNSNSDLREQHGDAYQYALSSPAL
ncbi:hypothetical protein V5O48_006435 [Marasmius crinis-equi]|uniref:Uncharacterized protein n=1 Tax=Marasmius crinis-equi TaxID=585013 RepID=A0ABR3FJQ0_9AGAR